jgi:serine/threonine protein kinase
MADHVSQELDLREVRIGRILSDLHERRQCGEIIDDDQILAENPDLENELRTHLATLCQLSSDEVSITRLIRQGVLSTPVDESHRATFGDYQVIEGLGHGGMGIVLKAYDEKLRRVVAIKLLRRELADDNIANARFLREARAAASLAHPNIVGVHAVGERNGSQFIAMEYVDGPSLSQVIRQGGALPTEQIRSLFGQLLTGLAAAHAAGLIHRDIKPANLLLANENGSQEAPDKGRNAILKIADFGLARITSSQTQLTLDNHSFGTPEYMSPEQARGDEIIDTRTDLYSAGAVLYEMLTGRTPFRASSSSATIRQIIDVAPPGPRSIHPDADPSLSSLALRLLAKRPDDRFASAAEVLAAMMTNRPVTDREKWRRRVWTLASGLVALGAIAAIAWVSRSINPRVTEHSKIKAVRSESKRYLQVMMEGAGEWQLLHEFSSPIFVNGSAAADVDGHGDRIAVAAVSPPENGDCLIAYESSGRERWRLNLSSQRHWPDCSEAKGFSGIQVVALPLDEVPGDELIVVASDTNEYPTRVSIVAPGTNPPRILGTFWHLGDIGPNDLEATRVQIVPNFFDGRRPAILILGVNNKLDGFEDRGNLSPQFWTIWNIVTCVMILDPAELMRLGECVGPPATDLIDLPRGGVYAYAFCDLSFDPVATTVLDAPGRRVPLLGEQGGVLSIQASGAQVTDGTGPWFQLLLESRRKADGAVLHLDRNLGVRIALTAPTMNKRSKEGWQKLWVPVIQEGRWLKAGAMSSKP